MKQFIGALLLIGCLVACDPSPCTEAIEASQETTKSNPIVTNEGQYLNNIIVYTSDSTDQFVFSIYPKIKVEDDKHLVVIFPPEEQVGNKRFANQFKFTVRTGSRRVPENILAIKIAHSKYDDSHESYAYKLQYFQDIKELNNYTNKTDDVIVGVYSKKYTAENIIMRNN